MAQQNSLHSVLKFNASDSKESTRKDLQNGYIQHEITWNIILGVLSTELILSTVCLCAGGPKHIPEALFRKHHAKLHSWHDRYKSVNGNRYSAWSGGFSVCAAFEKTFPKENVLACAATQEPCSCFRQQIFTKQQTKNKVGGKDLWRCCCVEFGGGFVFPNSTLR